MAVDQAAASSTGNGPPPLVSVVFSFRNEADNIPELLARVDRALTGIGVSYETVFVNDDSDDGSLALLTDRARTDPRIKVITMSRRFGPAECALAGLRHASGDAVVIMDADLQDPPELIPTLVARWREGADVVHTTRTRRLGEPPLKMLATRIAYRILRGASDIDLPVDAGDFKLFSRRALDELIKLREHNPYLRGLVVWIGFRHAFVPYERQARFAGRTHFPFFSRNPWRTFFSGLSSFSFVPLAALVPVGALLALAGSVLGIAAIALTGRLPAGTWIVAVMLVLAGIQLASLGIVGLYVGRVYADVRGRPAYIIESVVNLETPMPPPGDRLSRSQ